MREGRKNLRYPADTQKSRKNLLRKPSYSQFCLKFRFHGNGLNGGQQGVNINVTIN